MADVDSGPIFVEGSRVVLVEDDGERLVWFGEWAWHRRISLWVTGCPEVAISWLLTRPGVDALFLDQDLGQGDAVGRDVSTWLIQHPEAQPAIRLYVHSMNVVASLKIERELREAGRSVARIPFDQLMQQWRDSSTARPMSKSDELMRKLDEAYTEADLDRIAAALHMIPCDPSATLILELFATLHASCERGWRGDPLVYPPWVKKDTR